MPTNKTFERIIHTAVICSILATTSLVLAQANNTDQSGTAAAGVRVDRNESGTTANTGTAASGGTKNSSEVPSGVAKKSPAGMAKERADHPVELENEINRKAQSPRTEDGSNAPKH